jgi:hypothetical protein
MLLLLLAHVEGETETEREVMEEALGKCGVPVTDAQPLGVLPTTKEADCAREGVGPKEGERGGETLGVGEGGVVREATQEPVDEEEVEGVRVGELERTCEPVIKAEALAVRQAEGVGEREALTEPQEERESVGETEMENEGVAVAVEVL